MYGVGEGVVRFRCASHAYRRADALRPRRVMNFRRQDVEISSLGTAERSGVDAGATPRVGSAPQPHETQSTPIPARRPPAVGRGVRLAAGCKSANWQLPTPNWIDHLLKPPRAPADHPSMEGRAPSLLGDPVRADEVSGAELISCLPGPALDDVCAHASRRSFVRGETVSSEGDPADSLSVVRRGLPHVVRLRVDPELLLKRRAARQVS